MWGSAQRPRTDVGVRCRWACWAMGDGRQEHRTVGSQATSNQAAPRPQGHKCVRPPHGPRVAVQRARCRGRCGTMSVFTVITNTVQSIEISSNEAGKFICALFHCTPSRISHHDSRRVHSVGMRSVMSLCRSVRGYFRAALLATRCAGQCIVRRIVDVTEEGNRRRSPAASACCRCDCCCGC